MSGYNCNIIYKTTQLLWDKFQLTITTEFVAFNSSIINWIVLNSIIQITNSFGRDYTLSWIRMLIYSLGARSFLIWREIWRTRLVKFVVHGWGWLNFISYLTINDKIFGLNCTWQSLQTEAVKPGRNFVYRVSPQVCESSQWSHYPFIRIHKMVGRAF